MRRLLLGGRLIIEGGAATVLLVINFIPMAKALYAFLLSVPVGIAIALVLSWDAVRLKRKLESPESQLFGDERRVAESAPPER